MKTALLSLPALMLALVACDPESPVGTGATTADPAGKSDSVQDPTAAEASRDTLRFRVEDGIAGRVMLTKWYHASFSEPILPKSLADRPVMQAFALPGESGWLALPARVDSSFEFYARIRQIDANDAGGKIDDDTVAHYEAEHRWALAPLLVAATDEIAKMTIGQIAAGAEPLDGEAYFSEHVLFWVRDSIVADDDGLLRKRKLTGRFGRGWHLLQYRDSGRSLTPVPLTDTIRFRKSFPNPNLV